MNTRVRRSFRPGVPFMFTLLAAGAVLVGLGCQPAPTMTGRPKPQRDPELLVYSFNFSAASPCTITQGDVVFKDAGGKVIPGTDCDGDKKCGVASRRNGDSIRFESIPANRAFEVLFDPLKKGSFPGNATYKIDRDAPVLPTGKSYPFSVVATGCDPLDPRVVVDP